MITVSVADYFKGKALKVLKTKKCWVEPEKMGGFRLQQRKRAEKKFGENISMCFFYREFIGFNN